MPRTWPGRRLALNTDGSSAAIMYTIGYNGVQNFKKKIFFETDVQNSHLLTYSVFYHSLFAVTLVLFLEKTFNFFLNLWIQYQVIYSTRSDKEYISKSNLADHFIFWRLSSQSYLSNNIGRLFFSWLIFWPTKVKSTNID